MAPPSNAPNIDGLVKSPSIPHSGRVRVEPFEFHSNGGQVELKSVQSLAKEHEVQSVNYLSALNKDVGLLINFGPSGVEIKRKYRKPNQEI